MNDTIQKLLEPINPEQPCGPDLSNDPKYDELTAIAKGKPEVEMGSVNKPAEPPDWRDLRDKSAAYLGQSKHLNVALMYVCSLTRTDGLIGFCGGLKLMRGLLEKYWPALYPQLDPEDNNDPTQRLNILGTLTAPRGSISGWLRVVDYLYAAEICRPKGQPPISFEQLVTARDKVPGSPDVSQLSSAFSGMGGEVLASCQQSLKEALETAQGIDQFLTTTLGAGNTISFDTLLKSLQELTALLAPYMAGDAVVAVGGTDDEVGNASGGSASTISIRGAVKSREDVLRVIDSICSYYQQVEPSSPVPYVLRRAQKMVKMNFVETVQELSIANVEALRPSMGSAVDSAQPPSA